VECRYREVGSCVGRTDRGEAWSLRTSELQSRGCPFPSGQNCRSPRSAAQLQLFSVSLVITRFYEPRKSPVCCNNCARRPSQSAASPQRRPARHPASNITAEGPQRITGGFTAEKHGTGTISSLRRCNNAPRRPDDALLHDYMRTPPPRPSLVGTT
jgi:hypothetical protein